MTEYIEVQWASGSIDEARKVARILVQQRYVACAKITPWVESIFLLDNQLDVMQESKIFLTTHKDHFEAIKKIIQENCNYEVPEISFQYIDEISNEYKQWLADSLNIHSKA